MLKFSAVVEDGLGPEDLFVGDEEQLRLEPDADLAPHVELRTEKRVMVAAAGLEPSISGL